MGLAQGYDPENIRLVPEACLRDNGHVWPEGTSAKLRNAPAPGPAQAPGEGAVHRPRCDERTQHGRVSAFSLLLPILCGRFGGLYTLPGGHAEPFRRMMYEGDCVLGLLRLPSR